MFAYLSTETTTERTEMGNSAEKKIRELGVIPVVVLNDAEKAVPLAKALVNGGIPCAEVTFRTAAAEEAIRRIASSLPDMLLGAGTVLTIDQASRAVSAGARFIVSPGFDAELVDYCLAERIPVFPGCATPTEIMAAVKKGLNVVKLFPAQQLGGVSAVKALGAPFPGLSFIPTGGVSAKNLGDYLACDRVAACGGSWMVKASLVDEGDFASIEEQTREACALVKSARG